MRPDFDLISFTPKDTGCKELQDILHSRLGDYWVSDS